MLEDKVFNEMVLLLGKLHYLMWAGDFLVQGKIGNIFGFAGTYGLCCIFVIALKFFFKDCVF